MKISFIETGLFKLDGGAMFGVVPKMLWGKLNPPDEQNLCTWAMRCLLIETDNRKILVDTGIGDKQGEKFRSHFHPHGEHTLMGSLKEKGLAAEEITDVFLTHLHFDHAGGAVKYDEKGNLVPTFPNATYWSNEVHWKWAVEPNAREKASFLKENFMAIKDQNQLKFIDIQKDDLNWIPGIDIRFVYGHTGAMMLPIIKQAERTFVYCADLFPSSWHVRLPYVMAYDVQPLKTLAEKERLLGEAVENNWILGFEHDPREQAAILGKDERGRIGIKELVKI